MNDTPSLPETASELRDLILSRYDGFSKRLQQVARYVLDHPDDMALETLTVIAERSGSQPSAIVRFAKALGFTGANPVQRLLRDNLLASHTTLGYGERVRKFGAGLDGKVAAHGLGALLDEFAVGDTLSLQNLRETVSPDDLASAIELLRNADTVYIVGMRRSFPIAAYLAYSLPNVGKRAVFVDGVGGLGLHQLKSISPRDVMIAISYHAHAEETVAAFNTAVEAGAKVLSITDSLISPIAKGSAQTLLVRESEVRAFRSMSASICLAQTLVIGLAYEEEWVGLSKRSRRRKASTNGQSAS
jgi:DNA-binding MurR/RpiR family transcriptional regulator